MDSEDRAEVGSSKKNFTSSNLAKLKSSLSTNIRSYSKFLPTVFSQGYYKKFLRLGHVFKQKRQRSPYVDYMPGLYPESKMTPNNTIKESITKSLQRKAVRHVTEYLRSPDGDKLKAKVNDIIQGKISEKKKVQNKSDYSR
jgi:hypothetical protein